MAIADTAELNVLLRLTDQLSQPTTAATSKIKGLETAASGATTGGVSKLASGLDKAGASATGFGGKLARTGSNLKGLEQSVASVSARGLGNLTTGFARAGSVSDLFGGKLAGLKSKLSNLAAGGISALSGIASRTGNLFRAGFGIATSAVGRFGDALGHAKGRLLGLLSGPLGLLGLGGGVLSLVGLFRSGVDEVKDFSAEVSTLAKLTGLSVTQTSLLAGALHHFNIEGETAAKIAGLTEKNLSALTTPRAKAIDFQRQYGLAVLTSSGHVKNFNELLLTAADYFTNKSIPAQTKAAALAKLFGRSWQELLPVLSAGRKGIQDAEEEAQRLGLTLTTENLAQLKELKNATRDWGTAFAGLKLQIGLVAIPFLTNLFTGATKVLSENRVRIVGFFRDIGDEARGALAAIGNVIGPLVGGIGAVISAIGSGTSGLSLTKILADSTNFARDLGSVLKGTVVPAVNGVIGAWNSLPAQLRQLLIEGFIANKIVKWTFGFDAIGFGKQLAGSFISNTAGKLTAEIAGGGIAGALEKVGIGKAFVQPVFVTNEGFGGLAGAGGKAGGAVGAAEGGLLGTAKGVVKATIVGAVVVGGLDIAFNAITDALNKNNALAAQGLTAQEIQARKFSEFSAQDQQNAARHGFGPNQAPSPGGVSNTPLGEHALDHLVDANNKANAILGAGLTQGHRDMDKLGGTVVGAKLGISRALLALHGPLNKLDAVFARDFHALIAATKANDVRKFADKVANEIHRGVGSLATTERTLDHLKARRDAALKAGQTDLARRLGRDIAKVEAKIPGRQYVQRQINAAEKLFRSSEGNKAKLDGLRAITRDLRAHGDRHAANEVAKLAALIGAVNSLPGRIHLNVSLPRYDPVHKGIIPGRNAAGGFIPRNAVSFVGEEGPEIAFGEGTGTRIIPIPGMQGRRSSAISQLRSYFADVLSRTAASRVPYRDTPERRSLTVNLQQRLATEVSTSSLTRATTINRRYGTQWS